MGKAIKKQVWVKNISLDLHEGATGDYIMLTKHDKDKRHRVAIPASMVKEIAQAMLSLTE